MPKTRYRPLSGVRLRTRSGETFDFDSLDAFVRHLPTGFKGRQMIAGFGRRLRRVSEINPIASVRVNTGVDGVYVLEDIWGEPIDREILRDAFEAVQPPRPVPRYRMAETGRTHRWRAGPVPHTGNRPGCSWLRAPHTTQEKKAWVATQAEAREVAAPVKARRKRALANLPDTYDDIPRGDRERNWKRHRRTQYRPVDKTLTPET